MMTTSQPHRRHSFLSSDVNPPLRSKMEGHDKTVAEAL